MAEPSSPHPRAPEELGFDRIVYEKAPPRATIRLNRPDVLNAFDFRMLREIGKPTVARINGIAVGGGNEFQMACDLAVMVDDAFIRHVGLQHGSVPAAGATQWLPLIVGDRRAREIVMLCEEIPAAQALEWGLVNRVVPAGELDAAVDELVAKLADRLPLMTRYAKTQLDFWRDLAWHGTIRHAHDWLALSMLSDEAAGAVQAFLDRRKEQE